MRAPRLLEMCQVGLRRGPVTILSAIDLSIGEGEHWALLGPNGAGKTSLLGICAAERHPTSGTVRILGELLGRTDVRRLRGAIGHVDPRHAMSAPLTVREIILTGVTGTLRLPPRWTPGAADPRLVEDLAHRFGLGSRLEHRWPTLSQGERGRTLIARALAGGPRLLLMDEPATGLDLAARELLLTTMGRVASDDPRLASLTITHHLEDLPATTTHAMLLAEGSVVAAGPVDDVLDGPPVSRAFGHPIHVERRDGRWTGRAAPPAPPD